MPATIILPLLAFSIGFAAACCVMQRRALNALVKENERLSDVMLELVDRILFGGFSRRGAVPAPDEDGRGNPAPTENAEFVIGAGFKPAHDNEGRVTDPPLRENAPPLEPAELIAAIERDLAKAYPHLAKGR